MAYSDLREWIKTLEDKSMLRRVKAEVDWDREVGAVCRPRDALDLRRKCFASEYSSSCSHGCDVLRFSDVSVA